MTDLQGIVDAYRAHGKIKAAAARALGMAPTTFKDALHRASKQGLFTGNEIAPGFELKGYSEYTKTQDGNPIWLKAKAAEHDYWSHIRGAIEGLKPIDPHIIEAMPSKPQSDVIPWLQIGDAHIGMLANEMESSGNFDISIGEREICAAAAALIDDTPDCDRMVINDLGDGTHYETFKALTEASGHAVDFDTRYPKMIDAYIRITKFMVERAMQKAKVVDYIANQGNHSRSNDIWIAALIRSQYGPTGRVNVLNNSKVVIPYRMGDTFVLVHHGDKMKPDRLRNVMSTDYAIDWGETRFRYIDGGHIHHSSRKELEGCQHESWNNLAPGDKFAFDGGWRSRQCMTMVARSRTYGEDWRRVMPVERVRDIIRKTTPDHYCPPQQRAFAA